jgi:hypothetical protein
MLRMACGHRRFLPYLQDAVPVLLLLAAQLRRRGKVGNGGGTPSRKPLPRPALKGRVLQTFLRAGGEDTLEVRPRGREGGSVVQRRWGVVAVAGVFFIFPAGSHGGGWCWSTRCGIAGGGPVRQRRLRPGERCGNACGAKLDLQRVFEITYAPLWAMGARSDPTDAALPPPPR